MASRSIRLGDVIRIFGIAAAVYVIARLVYVLALGDVFFYGEELEKGTVAKMLLDGVDIPYARMPFHPYEGGGFVASHLKAFLFLLVGENLLAHKLAAILWGVGVVFASVGLGWCFGRGSASADPELAQGAGSAASAGGAGLLAGLLVALGPAHLQKQSLLHLGIHYEALLFMGFVFWLGLAVARVPRGQAPPKLTLFALGLASGFGTYFSYQVPIAVLSVIVLLAVTSWRRIFAWPLVAGTLVGLVPLALMYLAVGSEIVDIHGSDVGGEGGWSRLFGAVRVGLGGEPWLALFMVLAGALSVVGGVAFARPGGDRARALLLLGGFAVLWLVFAGMSGMVEGVAEGAHWVRFIRFAPLVWALLMLVALSAGPAISAKGDARATPPAKMTRIGVTLMVALGAVHAAQIIDGGSLANARANWTTLTNVRGYELRGAFAKVVPRLAREDDTAAGYARAAAPLALLEVPSRAVLVAELSAAVSQAAHGVGEGELGPALQSELSGPATDLDEPALARAIGLGLGPSAFVTARGDTGSALRSPGMENTAAEALGWFGTGFFSLPDYVSVELGVARGAPTQDAFLRGLGRRIFCSSVMQLYWGEATKLDPLALRERLVESQAEMGFTADELAALLLGIQATARDYGFPAQVTDRLVP